MLQSTVTGRWDSDQFLDSYAVSFVFILNYNYNGTSMQ